MSILKCVDNGWIICHSSYLHENYKSLIDENVCKCCQKYSIFHIFQQFLKKDQKECISKKKVKLDEFANEITFVEELFKKFLENITNQKYTHFTESCNISKQKNNNDIAIKAANTILESNTPNYFYGGNTESKSVCVTIEGEKYFIPANCKFYCDSIDKLSLKLANEEYDFILIDPPWRNKHIRRKNRKNPKSGYKMMHNSNFLEIPIDNLLKSDGLVAVWCTHSKQHLDYIKDTLFKAWNIQYISTWYWVKVTDHGLPIYRFCTETDYKKPYEKLIIGGRTNRGDEFKNPEPNKLIVSVPSSIHSHKPPLDCILKYYLPENNARCLELFARYLLPGWTSYGNEVLRLQNSNVYTFSTNIFNASP